MRALIVKTSSLGDMVHTLPAVTDAFRYLPEIRFDWVVEEAFAELPTWHPAVDQTIPIAIRRWRKNWYKAWREREIEMMLSRLRMERYELVIDAQGLFKSAIITLFANGLRYGMDRHSCREPLASFAYQRRLSVAKGRHAIDRLRDLFAGVFGYRYNARLNYGLNGDNFENSANSKPYLVFLHGTSWPTKLWAQTEWIALARIAEKSGYLVYLPWANAAQKARASEIASHCKCAIVSKKMNLAEIAGLLAAASGVVGVDTGLSHLAAALKTPAVTLYLVTDPSLTGARGPSQTCLVQGTLNGCRRPITENFRPGLDVVEIQSLTANNVWQYLTKKIL